MSALAWLAGLPIPSRTGFGYQRVDTTVRSSLGDGPSKARSLNTNSRASFSIGFVCDSAQWKLFEGFFVWATLYGVRAFTMPLEIGSGRQDILVKFVGSPTYDASFAPGKCRVTASVEAQ